MGASWSYAVLQRQQICAGERVLHALLEEVTVTLAQVPREACARVVVVYDKPTVDELAVIRTDGRTLVRDCSVVLGVR